MENIPVESLPVKSLPVKSLSISDQNGKLTTGILSTDKVCDCLLEMIRILVVKLLEQLFKLISILQNADVTINSYLTE